MRRLYRLQQRIALTQREARVLLGLAALFGAGLAAQHLWTVPAALPVASYASFQQHATAASLSRTLAAEALPPGERIGADSGASAPRRAARPAPSPDAPLALNTASAAELERLPRIGPALAGRIVAYREAHGGFRSVEDLQRVRGIGPKTMQHLRPLVEASQ